MPTEPFATIADYDLYLRSAFQFWSPGQRAVFAAAMAERWLPAYVAFSTAEDWGDPAGLRRSLDAVWAHLGGLSLPPSELARHAALVEGATPHLDDFDANEALCACVMLSDALNSCRSAENIDSAVDAALSGFQAVALDILLDPDSEPRLWRRAATRQERQKQRRLLELVGAFRLPDEQAIKALRARLAQPDLAGVVPARQTKPAFAGLTNQAAFEQYHRMVESDLKSAGRRSFNPGDSAITYVLTVFGHWSGRYRRRKDTIDGTFGRLADAAAMQALVARAQARDAAFPEIPAWDPSIRSMIDLCYRNPLNRLDAPSLEQPHGCGPSVRRLWAEAKRRNASDAEAWQAVLDWAFHRPPAWEMDDPKKKKSQKSANPAFTQALEREIDWRPAADQDLPWSAQIDGADWRVGLNDFPDDLVYRLEINGQSIGSFHDWPESWRR